MENYMEQYKYFSKKPLDKSFSRWYSLIITMGWFNWKALSND
jgi:hypothetical protein